MPSRASISLERVFRRKWDITLHRKWDIQWDVPSNRVFPWGVPWDLLCALLNTTIGKASNIYSTHTLSQLAPPYTSLSLAPPLFFASPKLSSRASTDDATWCSHGTPHGVSHEMYYAPLQTKNRGKFEAQKTLVPPHLSPSKGHNNASPATYVGLSQDFLQGVDLSPKTFVAVDGAFADYPADSEHLSRGNRIRARVCVLRLGCGSR